MYNLILNSKGNLTVKFAKAFTRFAKLKENSHRLMNLIAKFAKVFAKFAKLKENSHRLMNLTAKLAKIFAGFAKFYIDKALRTLRFMSTVLKIKNLACLAVKNTNTYFTYEFQYFEPAFMFNRKVRKVFAGFAKFYVDKALRSLRFMDGGYLKLKP